MQPVAPSDPSGGEVAQLRIEELESQVATLTTTNAQLQEQLRSASAATEPLNAKIAELEAENASRELQPCNYNPSICRLDVPQLRAKISDLVGTLAWHCAAPKKNSACGR